MNNPQELVMEQSTLDRLSKELEELTTTGRQEASTRLLRAREMGDLAENAEYHAAKDAQGLMEARIRQLQHMLKNAVVREGPASAEIVEAGVIVTVKEGDQVDEYLVASSTEEKRDGIATITLSSPMGLALAGRKVGESAVVKSPGGEFTVEITALRPS